MSVFSDHYLIQNKNYDFYLSILISESGAPFFGKALYVYCIL